jgi:hypothetical protein
MALAFSSRSRLTLVVPADSWMNPLRLAGAFPGGGVLGLGYLLVDPAQGAAHLVVPVLVVDDLVSALGRRPGGLGLGEDVPAGDVLAGVLAAPLRDDVRDAGGCACRG